MLEARSKILLIDVFGSGSDASTFVGEVEKYLLFAGKFTLLKLDDFSNPNRYKYEEPKYKLMDSYRTYISKDEPA